MLNRVARSERTPHPGVLAMIGQMFVDPLGHAGERLDLPFDVYTRASLIADFINGLSDGGGRIRVLDVGGRSGELESFLRRSVDLYVLDIRGPETGGDVRLARRGRYVIGDVLDTPLRDGTFDVVVSSDLLEHLHPDHRVLAVAEMLRVSRRALVVGAPFASSVSEQAERELNEFFRLLTGHEHPWLREHLALRPLPSRNALEQYLQGRRMSFAVLSTNNVVLWTQMQYLAFSAAELGVDATQAYRFYNSHFAALGDGAEPAYRHIYFVATDPAMDALLPRGVPHVDEGSQGELVARLNGFVYGALVQSMRETLGRKDRHIENLESGLRERDEHVADLESRVGQGLARIEAMAAVMGRLGDELKHVQEEHRKLTDHVARINRHPVWRTYLKARFWLAPEGSRRDRVSRALRHELGSLLQEGPSSYVRRATGRLYPRQAVDSQYQMWLAQRQATPAALEKLRVEARLLPYRPTISIVTPVYNTEKRWLEKAIESVLAQVYEQWELCLVDDASTDAHVGPLLREYAASDPRIKVARRSENGGIAVASNHGLGMATGEFIGFVDHDDELYPNALYDVARYLAQNPDTDALYSDEDKIDTTGRRFDPFFKPDWSPDLLLGMNYACHFSVYRRRVLEEIGGFREGFDGSQDYDLILRVSEKSSRIGHILKVLYGWRAVLGSAAESASAKPYASRAGQAVIVEALARRGRRAHVGVVAPGRYHVRYALRGSPLVTIIIPMRDCAELTQRCLASIEARSTYKNVEILIIDNGSVEDESKRFFQQASRRHRVLECDLPFNYSTINNFGAAHATGEYLLFLNSDTEVETDDWLEAMLGHAQHPEVGAVGAQLLYPDRRIQHGGIFIIGTDHAFAGHAFKYLPEATDAYFGVPHVPRNVTAVTGACMMLRREVFEEAGGFDERLRVAYGDVDLCLRLSAKGYLIVYTPLLTLLHHESATRKLLHPLEDERFVRERWHQIIVAGDPYYNPNLSLTSEDFRIAV